MTRRLPRLLHLALPVVLLVISLVPCRLAAQGPPITGTAQVLFSVGPTLVHPGGPFFVDVYISLLGMTGTSCVGFPTSLVLGGYQIAMEFDTTRLSYLGVSDGDCSPPRPETFSLPTATNAVDANTTGTVLFVATNGSSQDDPIGGPYCYFEIQMMAKASNVGHLPAVLRFRNNARGAYTLASAGLNCAPNPNAGPVSIPKPEDVTFVITTTPVSLSRFTAE